MSELRSRRRTYMGLVEEVTFTGVGRHRQQIVRVAPPGTFVRIEVDDDNEVVDKNDKGVKVSIEWAGHKLTTRLQPEQLRSLA